MRTHHLSMNDPTRLGLFPLLAKARLFQSPPATATERPEAVDQRAPTRPPEHRRGFLARLEYWFWVQQQRDLEAYLSKATDVYDLEARIRMIERNKSIPYY